MDRCRTAYGATVRINRRTSRVGGGLVAMRVGRRGKKGDAGRISGGLEGNSRPASRVAEGERHAKETKMARSAPAGARAGELFRQRVETLFQLSRIDPVGRHHGAHNRVRQRFAQTDLWRNSVNQAP